MLSTSDNQNERFDIVDENDHIVGKTTRGEAHRQKKYIHRSIGVAVFNERGELFLQQRGKSKDTDPLKWTISCSGHVASGDSYEETAHRELEEELGIDLPIEEVTKYLCHAPNETEMVTLFKAKSCGPFKLNPTEVIQGKFFTMEELKKIIDSDDLKLSYMGKKALEKLGWI